jgi:hypothetical protein
LGRQGTTPILFLYHFLARDPKRTSQMGHDC